MITNDVKKMVVWIKLYEIPLERWTSKGLSYIPNIIGKPLYLDSITEVGTRLEYAQICVEVIVDSKCLDSFILVLQNGENLMINVEYSFNMDENLWHPIGILITKRI